MRSANTIMKIKVSTALLLLSILPVLSYSQINSPYSRYGVGNLVPQGSLSNRAMGGISAAMTDPTSLNTVNPASYGNLFYTNLDLGFEYIGNNLKSKDPIDAFKSKYAIMSYLNLGIPLLVGNTKAQKHHNGWALAFGLKPVTRINYQTISSERTSIDSTSHLFQGDGGINKAFVGTAFKFNNFSIGLNTGYLFGQKDYTTRLLFQNDTVQYNKASYETKTNFGGMFLDAGIQYTIKLKKDDYLRLGAYSNLKTTYSGTRDRTIETFEYDVNGAPTRIDSVSSVTGEKGNVVIPATYGFGIVYENEHLLIGADYESTKWSGYSFFGQKDLVTNSWNARFGFQYNPATIGSTGYFSFVKYRAGVSFGRDYIEVDNTLPVYTISVGGAFPLRIKRSFYDHQLSIMNVTFEYSGRGNNKNNITENTFRVGFGFSLSDIWFLRQKYQ